MASKMAEVGAAGEAREDADAADRDGGAPAARGEGTERRAPDVRSRLHDAALKLFRRHGISDTTLQMIADDLGVTKAAVYYHYKSKDELVVGVVSPFLERFQQVVELAEAQRGRRAQVDVALTGFADLSVSAREVYSVLTGDPSIQQLRQLSPGFAEARSRAFDILAGPDPAPQTRIRVRLLLSGMADSLNDPVVAELGDHELRSLLVETGHRLLFQRS